MSFSHCLSAETLAGHEGPREATEGATGTSRCVREAQPAQVAEQEKTHRTHARSREDVCAPFPVEGCGLSGTLSGAQKRGRRWHRALYSHGFPLTERRGKALTSSPAVHRTPAAGRPREDSARCLIRSPGTHLLWINTRLGILGPGMRHCSDQALIWKIYFCLVSCCVYFTSMGRAKLHQLLIITDI